MEHSQRLRPDRISNHTNTDYTITVTGDRIKAVGDRAAFERFGDGPGLLRSICRYANQLVNEDGQWLTIEAGSHTAVACGGARHPLPRW